MHQIHWVGNKTYNGEEPEENPDPDLRLLKKGNMNTTPIEFSVKWKTQW